MRLVGAGIPKPEPPAKRNCGTCEYWGRPTTRPTVFATVTNYPCTWAHRSPLRPAWVDAARIGSPALKAASCENCGAWKRYIPPPPNEKT